MSASSVQFEIRTTIHFSLLAQEDAGEMCAVLLSKYYQANFYLQYALKRTPTLEPLAVLTGTIKTGINHFIHSIPVVERNY